MPAFGSPWGDIDRTPSGTPYVVGSDGWGWFMLFIMVSIPFFVTGLILTQAAEIICDHPYISIGAYTVFSIVLGILLYIRGQKRMRILGIIATVITLAPFALVEGLYMVPYILQNSLFAGAFEWFFLTATVGAVIFFILVIADSIKNGLIHLVISVIFFVIVFVILHNYLSSSEEINWSVVSSLYKF